MYTAASMGRPGVRAFHPSLQDFPLPCIRTGAGRQAVICHSQDSAAAHRGEPQRPHAVHRQLTQLALLPGGQRGGAVTACKAGSRRAGQGYNRLNWVESTAGRSSGGGV